VHRLCGLQKIASSIIKKRRHGKIAGPPVHDDHVNRIFHADRLDAIWLTDISEHPTAEGKLYVCAVKDVCSRRIVGWSIGPRMTSTLADTALRTAIVRRRPAGTTVVHSDRGGQFRSHRYQRTLRTHGLTGSMGRVSSAGDNAAMESFFFALLQKNVLNRQSWATRDELRLAIITWIEHLPPAPTSTGPGPSHTDRVRNRLRRQPAGRSSMTRTTTVNQTLGRPASRLMRLFAEGALRCARVMHSGAGRLVLGAVESEVGAGQVDGEQCAVVGAGGFLPVESAGEAGTGDVDDAGVELAADQGEQQLERGLLLGAW
jgi:hypothetical protein